MCAVKQYPEHLSRRRREFGVLLRQLRHEREMTCDDLAAKVGNISHSAIATIERGMRQAGSKVSERIADALGLIGDERRNFLVAALKTTASEVLPQEAAGMDPEYFLPIWKEFSGILGKQGEVKKISNNTKLSVESSTALKTAALKLAQKAEDFSHRLRAAITSPPNHPFLLDLEIETRDGKIVIVEILTGRS
jgi:transcriptional regulator with XRE-family HTH domain